MSILFSMLFVMAIPMLIATGFLAIHAQWRWRKTMDKILRGMKIKEVQGRVEKAVLHRKWARYHAIAMAVAVMITTVSMFVSPLGRGNFYRPLFDDFSIWMIFWFYGLFVPHMLALLLYHIRWNPKTFQRKQKLDAEDAVYEGNYDLDPGARYAVNDEGELIQLAMEDEMQKMQKSS